MYRHYIKRIFDFIFALYVILPITLLIAVYALLIKLEDWGPAFYTEKRVGRYGRTFKTYLLRTMKVDAQRIRNGDSRLTKVGKSIVKLGIDELPQLFNVLRGEMSFIGPRPDVWDHFRHYEVEELRKLQALPGISGYNQAYCRNSIERDQRLKNDVYYADNISFSLDLKILFRIIEQELFPKGIYAISKSRSVIDESTKE